MSSSVTSSNWIIDWSRDSSDLTIEPSPGDFFTSFPMTPYYPFTYTPPQRSYEDGEKEGKEEAARLLQERADLEDLNGDERTSSILRKLALQLILPKE